MFYRFPDKLHFFRAMKQKWKVLRIAGMITYPQKKKKYKFFVSTFYKSIHYMHRPGNDCKCKKVYYTNILSKFLLSCSRSWWISLPGSFCVNLYVIIFRRIKKKGAKYPLFLHYTYTTKIIFLMIVSWEC